MQYTIAKSLSLNCAKGITIRPDKFLDAAMSSATYMIRHYAELFPNINVDGTW